MNHQQTQPDDVYYDPYSEAVDSDPYPVWKRMRDEAPVYYNDVYEFYALSRYEDVLQASRDYTTFSSARGTVLEKMDLPPAQLPKFMLSMDPPEHTRRRRQIDWAFRAKEIHQLEPRVRDLCVGYLDQFVGAGSFDYVQDFAVKLPMMVIGSMLGVPDGEQDEVRRWTEQLSHRSEGHTDYDLALHGRLREYFLGLAGERKQEPRDDLITALVQSELEEEGGSKRKLTDEELGDFILMLVAAGNDTTNKLIGWIGYLLAMYPEERRKVLSDPDLSTNAVEEILRFEPPSPVQARWSRRPSVWSGNTIPADSKVLLLTAAAQRDERKYENPDRFDVTRSIDQQLSFGHGVHLCLGRHLARLEGRVAMEETLRRFPHWEVDEEGSQRMHTSTVRGWKSLPIIVS